MKKDIEWLKNEVNELPLRFLGFSMLKQREEFTVSKDDVLELINQLDEPEVLTDKWVDDNSVYASSDGITEEYVHVGDLQNLLVPKESLGNSQELEKVQIPKIVAEFLDGKEDYALHELFDNEWLYEKYDQIAKWLYDNDEYINREREADLALAHMYGYEVEEEQKYIISISITDKDSNTNYETFLNKRGIFHSMENDSFNSEEFNWSEEEIRGLTKGDILFEHFAVKVEELEE